MGKKLLCVMLALCLLVSVFAAGKKDAGAAQTTGEAVGYTYGLNKTFYSEQPVTYSMFFSDASWYPMKDEWKTEGVFAEITKKTNVTLDIRSFDSGDYTNKIKLDINAGNSAYIIPKVYEEGPFVDGGAVVPVSDYVQYMPNYMDFYTKYNMKDDVNTIVRSNGKYYRLPGMLEKAMQDYTIMVRDDIFKAAGYDVKTLEKDWTWESLYDVLVGVKKYMVSKGMCKESSYIWSDLWCGSESGQGKGGNLLKLMGASYNVPSGWAVGNGMQYNKDKDEWYFASTSKDYKDLVTLVNKYVKGGILDPETFTQTDSVATAKFYNGETVIMSVNRGQYQTWVSGLDAGKVGKGNYTVYVTVYPKGTNKYAAENSRLENGVMIAEKARKELGEDGFIKMLRFVDWLWYSQEAYTLHKWGIEGKTFQYVTDDATGLKIKKLMPGYKCGGLGIGGTDKDEDIRLKWGFAGGNFYYGHTVAEMSDNFIPVIQDYYARLGKYRETRPVNPPIKSTEDENEQLNLWLTPLIDNVNAWTLQFVTGQKDINKEWDAYVASCKNLNSEKVVALINEINKRK